MGGGIPGTPRGAHRSRRPRGTLIRSVTWKGDGNRNRQLAGRGARGLDRALLNWDRDRRPPQTLHLYIINLGF